MLEDTIKIAQFENGPEFAARELADQIIEWTAGTGAKGAVVGLSGGVDSTAVAYLCKKAFDAYNADKPEDKQLKLYGLIMPSKVNSPKDAEDGKKVAEALGIEYKVIPIEPIADSIKASIPEAFDSEDTETQEFNTGNLYSEARAIVLSRYAGAKNCRVMGTGNRDEDYILGYFTKRGDGAVDNNILGKLPKRLVRELAAHLGADQELVERVPTAGLWEGQTDEGELGYSYDAAEVIQNGFDQGKTPEQIQKITGYDRTIINDVAYRHRTTEHKRQAPPVGQVSLVYR